MAQTTSEVQGDTGSELKLQWCWQRRGVAFDRCGLMSWTVHEKWVKTMLNNWGRETRFRNIKTEQLIRADRELFTILSQEHPGGGCSPHLFFFELMPCTLEALTVIKTFGFC